jgi:hypothetical protein
VSAPRWQRVVLGLGIGLVALVVLAVAVLLKLAELSYRSLETARAADERAAVGELRRLLSARRPGAPPLPPAAEEAGGYRWRLVDGATTGRFAYVAVPQEREDGGRSAFCADAGGLVRFDLKGEEPALVDGACPASWLILREDLPAPLR